MLIFQKVLGEGSSQIAYGTAIAGLLLVVLLALVGTVRALLRLRQDNVVAVL